MTTEHTPAEVAAAHRVLADDEERRWGKLHRSGTAPIATWHRKKADELDPPKPTWPDGTIATVTHTVLGGRENVSILIRRDGRWKYANGIEGTHDSDVIKVEPLRVLGDDEIAVRRIYKSCGAESWRMEANDAQGAKRPTYAASSLCRAYADALEAEAGDAK